MKNERTAVGDWSGWAPQTVNKPKSSWWIHRIMVALSQLLNAVLGGMPDETLSSRIHRHANAGEARYARYEVFVNLIFFWELNHCHQAWLDEVNRRHHHPDIIAEQDKRKGWQ